MVSVSFLSFGQVSSTETPWPACHGRALLPPWRPLRWGRLGPRLEHRLAGALRQAKSRPWKGWDAWLTGTPTPALKRLWF